MPDRVQGLRWNPTLARYIDERGRIVSRDAVARALDVSLANAQARARLYAEQLRRGDVSLVEWERSMRVLIKDSHIFATAGSVGGWAQLGPAEYGRIGNAVRDQYEFLYGFARDIASGKQSLGGVAARAALYVEAARTTAESQQLASDMDAGYDEEHNRVGVADHCDECPMLSSLGWVPVGSLPLPGRRQCGTRCKCRIERRVSPARRRQLAREQQAARDGRAPSRTLNTTPAKRAAGNMNRANP
jgi:hypothetical protein